jgi:hypothetical protein
MTSDNSKLLRYAFRGNAAFSGLAGMDMILFSDRIAELLGVADPRLFVFLGVGLIAWAGHLLVASRRESLSLREAWYFVSGDVLWVLGSVAVLVRGGLSTQGMWAVGLVALGVLGFAEAQFFGIRRLQRNPTTTPLTSTA